MDADNVDVEDDEALLACMFVLCLRLATFTTPTVRASNRMCGCVYVCVSASEQVLLECLPHDVGA